MVVYGDYQPRKGIPMDRKEVAKQLRDEAAQMVKAADMLDGTAKRPGRKPGTKVAAKKVGRKPAAKKSKNGKRLGRPPKIATE
jgi:hypothetical protein